MKGTRHLHPSIEPAMTYDAIAARLGISSRRVRQIEDRAMEKIWEHIEANPHEGQELLELAVEC